MKVEMSLHFVGVSLYFLTFFIWNQCFFNSSSLSNTYSSSSLLKKAFITLYKDRQWNWKNHSITKREIFEWEKIVSMASKLLMITVFVLDVIAFALAIAAEQRRSTVCTYIFFSLIFIFTYPYLFLFWSRWLEKKKIKVQSEFKIFYFGILAFKLRNSGFLQTNIKFGPKFVLNWTF